MMLNTINDYILLRVAGAVLIFVIPTLIEARIRFSSSMVCGKLHAENGILKTTYVTIKGAAVHYNVKGCSFFVLKHLEPIG